MLWQPASNSSVCPENMIPTVGDAPKGQMGTVKNSLGSHSVLNKRLQQGLLDIVGYGFCYTSQ